MATKIAGIETLEGTQPTGIAVSGWGPLYKIAAAAAVLIAVSIPLAAAVFIASPPPDTAVEYFEIFQENPLLGMLDLDLIMLIDQVLMVPIVLALYVALRRSSESFMAIGAALSFIGIAAYFASRDATFAMLALSQQYAAATTEAQRALFLAAGQSMLASYNGTAFHLSYNLGQIAGIIISVVMLRSTLFSKAAAYAGILGNLIGFGLYLPGVGIYISLFSVVGLWIWYLLIARSLWRLGH
jgi:hypothetical protein